MSDQHNPVEGTELQFDRVIHAESTAAASPGTVAVTCAACKTSIDKEYYDVNGHSLCDRCRAAAESSAETPRGAVPFVTAGVFGFGAGLVGAAIYYAVIAIAHLEIGIVAILIGYVVGYAVRKGARGRGGRRFQVLAVALTYTSIALAYAPLAFMQAARDTSPAQQSSATTASGGSRAASPSTAPSTSSPTEPPPRGRSLILSILLLVGLTAALPVLMVTGSLPSGLISAFIIFIGMRQAWTMTGSPRLQILGPFRVGASTAPTSA